MDNLEADVLTDLYNPKPLVSSAPTYTARSIPTCDSKYGRAALSPSYATPEEVAVINVDPEATQEGIWYLSHLVQEIRRQHRQFGREQEYGAGRSL